MQTVSKLSDQIHEQALEIAARHRRSEAELVEVLQQVESHRVFLEKDCSSLFEYAVKILKLSRDVAYGLITISRKAREVPELKESLKRGEIHLTNAKRVASVLTLENKATWLKKASEMSERQLEKEIATVRPQILTPERAGYVTQNRIKLEIGLFEKNMLELRRVQDLESQRTQRPVTLEDVIVTMVEDYLRRHDPVKKAKRHVVRNGILTESHKTLVSPKLETELRDPIPAAILHQVNLRDERRCRYETTTGARCNQSRWLEIHHKKPVSHGGENTLENLITLCSSHHGWVHRGIGR